MTSAHAEDALLNALQFVKSSNTPSEHKVLLIDLLTAALRERDVSDFQALATARVGGPWLEPETLEIRSYLQGKVAISWQNADEMVMHLAARLRRDPGEVRRKATDLGCGAGVDYRLARILAATAARVADVG